ncbi:MAG: acetyl-CoA carboxylase biotin carboxylase subunit [Gammaproteobacteria bacterium]|nr:acetyl-CoA carboxylase biotin carboxylase subunit [Gammaproteobacteria bacterium]
MNKLLVANRGEIACRVLRSARKLGVSTVAVYSDADEAALHTRSADEAVRIGPARAAESYLNVDALLAAARRTGADSIHPGYGFLAENAAFATQVIAAGLTFVGPTPEQIEAMGDKARARGLALAAGVPIVPGSARFTSGELGGLEAAAAKVGYPLLVKAAAGGGGIGMRLVEDPIQLLKIAEATQTMATRSFGDGAIFLERYIPKARHIEIQVFGFGDGRAIHLFERDCSIQRRFQKVIEESPAPGLPESIRQRMAEAAVTLAGSQQYAGAGTVEFIVDAVTFDFFFLEMNTRIQVEHPVTEMITGEDLVELQLRLARGERLAHMEQAKLTSHGHAIECRIYAENPLKMFLPSPGKLNVLRLPAASSRVRIDTGVREGDTITAYYDPMIAKVVCWGESRAAALSAMVGALASSRIEGISSNIDFLGRVIGHAAFSRGDVFTGFIEEYKQDLIA